MGKKEHPIHTKNFYLWAAKRIKKQFELTQTDFLFKTTTHKGMILSIVICILFQ